MKTSKKNITIESKSDALKKVAKKQNIEGVFIFSTEKELAVLIHGVTGEDLLKSLKILIEATIEHLSKETVLMVLMLFINKYKK